jgi:hypothetical protein
MARILIVKKTTYEVYLDVGGKTKILAVAEKRSQAKELARTYEKELGLPNAGKSKKK